MDFVVLAAAGLIAWVLWHFASAIPLAAGSIDDDGIYLVTARSIADGRGYRHFELPGAPYQTKYPILYPFLLSLVWRASPEFPGNVAAMQAVQAVLCALMAWLTFRFARRVWKLSTSVAASGAVLTLVNPWTFDMVRMTMAEPLFAVLSLASLTLAPAALDAPKSWRSTAIAVLAGSFAGAAALTRSIGVALVPALAFGALVRKRWRDGSVLVGAASIFLVAWAVWRAWASGENARIASTTALAYDLDYGIQVPRELSILSRVVLHNGFTAAFVLLHMIGRPTPEWTSSAIAHGAWLHVLIAACFAVCMIGLFALPRRVRAVSHAYIAITTALVLVWPYEPERFFFPLLPLFTLALLNGVRAIGAWAARWIARDSTFAMRAGTTCAVVCAALLLARYAEADVDAARSPYHASLAKKREAVAAFVDRNSPPHAVIAGYQGAYYWLVTGRKFIPLVQSESPVEFFYPADRKLFEFGTTMTPLKLRAFDELVAARAPQYYRDAGATLALTTQDSGSEGYAQRRWRRKGSVMRLVASAGPFQMYAVGP